MKCPIKLTGVTTWIYYSGRSDLAATEALIRNDNEIVVECKWDNHYYTVPLHSDDGVNFKAEFDCKTATTNSKVITTCKLWSNKFGYMLFGTWIEGGDEMHWKVELKEKS